MLVDFFFVLSGFVLAHAYFGRDGSIADFVRRRLLRLYPLHVFALLVFFAVQGMKLAFAAHGVSLRNDAFAGLNAWNFIDTLLLLQSTGVLWHEITWNPPSWSISTELFANVIVFVLLAAFGRQRLSMICGALLVSIVAYFLLAGINAHDYGPMALLRCLATFSLGCLIYQLYRWRVHGHVGTRAPISLLATGYELLALGAMLVGVLAVSLTGVWLVSAVCFAYVIYVFAFEAGWVSHVLKRARLPWFGTISYSLYLNHIAVGSVVSAGFLPVAHWLALSAPLKVVVFTALFFTVLTAYSWLTFRFVELPAQRFFSWRRTRGLTQSQQAERV
jgi:peptidoglycan/LPS O-acetylase OafA/YrhL